jgi:hypothetical protein
MCLSLHMGCLRFSERLHFEGFVSEKRMDWSSAQSLSNNEGQRWKASPCIHRENIDWKSQPNLTVRLL